MTSVAVVLSMLTLIPGAMGGSETYARELLIELGRQGLEISTLVSPIARGFSGQVPERVATQFRTGPSSAARAASLGAGIFRRRSLSQYTATADVVHFPFTIAFPRPRSGQASVVSLLDVQHHDLPHLFSRAERAYRGLAYDKSACNADAVITISDFSKERIVRHLDIDPGKVHVAHLAVRGDEYQPQLGARGSFLLYPARGWPHKNHVTLFSAFEILRRRSPLLRLVLTGATAAELPPVPNGVEVRGQLAREQLIALYGTAGALVFPSRYEGFGLPVLEAMASGCPVAAASAGSLPEVVGEAAVLFDPLDPEEMALAIEATLDRAAELQLRGLAQASRFTWSACASVHARVYARLGS